jgi:hypothetical protein
MNHRYKNIITSLWVATILTFSFQAEAYQMQFDADNIKVKNGGNTQNSYYVGNNIVSIAATATSHTQAGSVTLQALFKILPDNGDTLTVKDVGMKLALKTSNYGLVLDQIKVSPLVSNRGDVFGGTLVQQNTKHGQNQIYSMVFKTNTTYLIHMEVGSFSMSSGPVNIPASVPGTSSTQLTFTPDNEMIPLKPEINVMKLSSDIIDVDTAVTAIENIAVSCTAESIEAAEKTVRGYLDLNNPAVGNLKVRIK